MERHSFYSKTGTFTLPGGVFELSGMISLECMPEHREHGEECSARRRKSKGWCSAQFDVKSNGKHEGKRPRGRLIVAKRLEISGLGIEHRDTAAQVKS